MANFQSDASANNQKKLCENDLAAPLTNQLRSAGGCQAVIKEQLKDIDSLGLTIESVAVTGSSALARVKSTYSGKNAHRHTHAGQGRLPLEDLRDLLRSHRRSSEEELSQVPAGFLIELLAGPSAKLSKDAGSAMCSAHERPRTPLSAGNRSRQRSAVLALVVSAIVA